MNNNLSQLASEDQELGLNIEKILADECKVRFALEI